MVATIAVTTPAHTTATSGAVHSSIAAGTGIGSHGNIASASRLSGRRDAPARISPRTTRPASITTISVTEVTGRIPSRDAPASPRATAPWDSHPAVIVHRTAIAVSKPDGRRRDGTGAEWARALFCG